MRKLVFVFLIFAAVITAHAQKRFELDVTTKMGYYFPVNERHIPSTYFPKKAVSPAVGISMGYTFFKSTGVFLGMEYCYLSPRLNDYFGDKLDVTWQSFNVPLYIQQGIGKNYFLTGGVTLIRQLRGYWSGIGYNSIPPEQDMPEYNWHVGAGYKLNDLRISLQYSRGFKNLEKYTKSGENSYFSVDLVHQEILVKLEYSLWRF